MKLFAKAIQKMFSSIRKVARYTRKQFKKDDSATSDELYYIRIVDLMARRAAYRRLWLKNYSIKALQHLEEEALQVTVKAFVANFDGFVAFANAEAIWEFMTYLITEYIGPIDMKQDLDKAYVKKYPQSSIPVPVPAE